MYILYVIHLVFNIMAALIQFRWTKRGLQTWIAKLFTVHYFKYVV